MRIEYHLTEQEWCAHSEHRVRCDSGPCGHVAHLYTQALHDGRILLDGLLCDSRVLIDGVPSHRQPSRGRFALEIIRRAYDRQD